MNIHDLKDGIIAGMILGDGHLSKVQTTLALKHTTPQLAYLEFKLGLGQQLQFSARRFRITKKLTNLGLYEYCSGTITGGNLKDYYGCSTKTLVEMLNPLGLLIWWCDDGCLVVHHKNNDSISRFGYLNTQGYGLDGNELIQDVLFQKFNISTTIHIDSKSGFAKSDHYRLYLNATNMRRLIDLVREFIPWVPKCMLYKFNMQYVINRLKDSFYLVTNYNF